MPLESLYQDKILELARLARSVSPLNDFSSSFTVRNPICGDMVTINLLIDNSGIVERYVILLWVAHYVKHLQV